MFFYIFILILRVNFVEKNSNYGWFFSRESFIYLWNIFKRSIQDVKTNIKDMYKNVSWSLLNKLQAIQYKQNGTNILHEFIYTLRYFYFYINLSIIN